MNHIVKEERNKKLILGLALVLSFAVNFDSAVVIPLIANYAVYLGASAAMAGLIVGVYSMVHIPSNVFFGRIVDKVGRKIPLTAGLILDGFSLFLYSVVNNSTLLLLARILHGIGGGLGGPATMSYIGDLIPRKTSGRGMALYGMSVAFAMLFGFMIGGIGVHFFGYVALFRYSSYVLLVMAALSLTLPSIYRHTDASYSLLNELKVLKQIISRKDLLSSYISIFAVNFVLGIITTVYAISLKRLGYRDAQIGMFFALMVLTSILTQYPAGVLGDKIGKSWVIILGLISVTSSLIIISISSILIYVIIGMLILGLGHGLIYPASAGNVKEKAKSDELGLATGLFYGLLVAGVATGAPVSGLIYELWGYIQSLYIGVLLSSIAIVPVYVFGRNNH